MALVTNQDVTPKDCLERLISGFEGVVVAFSGGVDSSFLAKICYDILGERCLAVTVDSPLVPRYELSESERVASCIGIPHQIIHMDQLARDVLTNTRERCYFCKCIVLDKIRGVAIKRGIQTIVEGSNVDDLSDFRPGFAAVKERNVISPLIECGFTKSEIRRASKELGLDTWDNPSLACLASRIPYDTEITLRELEKIEKSESYLRDQGIKQLRVRCHGDLARIEVALEERIKFADPIFMDRTVKKLKGFGFSVITLDLEGYETGRMNRDQGFGRENDPHKNHD